MEINQQAPDFELTDLNGDVHKLSKYLGQIVIVNFWSAECPHSERVDRALTAMLTQWGEDVTLLSVASNCCEPVERLAQAAAECRLPTVLVDSKHSVADLFEAQTTPQLFVIDRGGILRYRGALDDATFRQRVPTRTYLDEAVESLLAGRLPAVTETPAFGCTIVREV